MSNNIVDKKILIYTKDNEKIVGTVAVADNDKIILLVKKVQLVINKIDTKFVILNYEDLTKEEILEFELDLFGQGPAPLGSEQVPNPYEENAGTNLMLPSELMNNMPPGYTSEGHNNSYHVNFSTFSNESLMLAKARANKDKK